MMKRSGLRSLLGAALVSGVIYVSALAAPALAMNPCDDSSAPGLDDAGAAAFYGPAREGQRLWPAVHYPVIEKVTQPKFVELAQPTGPARLEYRLWPVIQFSKEVPIAKPWVVELAKNATGPARAEYHLWPVTVQPAAEGTAETAQEDNRGAELVGAPGAADDYIACIIASEQKVLASM